MLRVSSCGRDMAITFAFLQWIIERVEGKAAADETAIGYVPKPGSINTEGLKGVKENMPELLAVEKNKWKDELDLIREQYATFGNSSS